MGLYQPITREYVAPHSLSGSPCGVWGVCVCLAIDDLPQTCSGVISSSQLISSSRNAFYFSGRVETGEASPTGQSTGASNYFKGYPWPFITPPPVTNKPVDTPLAATLSKREALWMEVQSLLEKGAIETHCGWKSGSS